MKLEWFKCLHPGAIYLDRNGKKIGAVLEIHEWGRAIGLGGSETVEGYLHCDTRYLRLGKDLYIPFSAFREVTSDHLVLDRNKDDLVSAGWDRKPADIPTLPWPPAWR